MKGFESIQAAAGFDAAAIRWDAEAYPERLWLGDPTVWSEEEAPELADRLGWLDLHKTMRPRLAELEGVAEGLAADGVLDVVLCGMGGSSLAPEVFAGVWGPAPGRPTLTILDSTHPHAVEAVAAGIDPDRSAFIISSKSGTTVETLSLYRYFWELAGADGGRFLAITDAGTPLDGLAAERRFRAVITAPSDVGGRYSALTPFGLLPAAVIGADIAALLDSAAGLVAKTGTRARAARAADDPAIALGLAWAAQAQSGRDKLTIRTSPGLGAFPAWLEQLVAESLGKQGRGIVPVAGEPHLSSYGPDRTFVDYLLTAEEHPPPPGDHPHVSFGLTSPTDLGAEMLRAEVATAVAGQVLGVHPFDQPDVERAKQLARSFLDDPATDTVSAVPAGSPTFPIRLQRFLDQAAPRDYLAIQAFLAPDPDIGAAGDRLRRAVADRYECATTFGYGPRFLHSTGQLHKGGPPTGLFLQLIDRPERAVPVPETEYTLAQLIAAQAAGDATALREADRRVLRVDVTGDGLEALVKALA